MGNTYEERESNMRKLDEKWYHYKSKNSEFYAIKPVSIKKYFYVGAGEVKPCAKQVLELFNKIESEEKGILMRPEHVSEGLYSTQQIDPSAEVDLPPGTYQYVDGGYNSIDRLVPVNFRKDGFVKTGDIYDDILDDIKSFLSKEEVYRNLNVMYKRGLLLYGPPGNGKTAIIRAVVHAELPKDAVTIIFDKSLPDPSFLNVMKTTLENRTKLFIFEELTDFIKNDNMEDLLTFLDGEFSIDKSLIIATTNYPENLPGNIVDRQSRFDTLYKVGNPNANQRKIILAHYLQNKPTKKDVEITDKLSTAAIKEVVLLSKLRDISIEKAVGMVKKHSDLVKKHFEEEKERMGL